MKRIVSFLLVITMMASMLFVSTVAVSAEAVTKSEDFQGQTVGGAYVKNEWSHGVQGGTTELSIAADGDNKYMSVHMPANSTTDAHLVYPVGFEYDTYVFTGDLKIDGTATGNYFGLYVVPNLSKPADNAMMVLRSPGGYNYVKTCDADAKHGLYELNEWCSFEYIRKGTYVSFSFWKKAADKSTASTWTMEIPAGAATPAFRIVSWSTSASTVCLDNLSVINEIPSEDQSIPSAMVYSAADFEDAVVNSSFSATQKPTRQFGLAEQSNVTEKVVTENGNNIYTVSRSASQTGAFRFYPYNTTYDRYVISGDVRFDTKNTAGYYGFYLAPDLQQAHADVIGVLSYADNLKVTNFGDQEVTNLNYETWYSFEYIRIGTNVAFRFWEKGSAKPATATLTRTVPEGKADPTLRFVGSAAGTVSLDNLQSSELSALTFIGAQSTGKLDANNEYAVRFIAGINTLDYSKVGFTVVATPANGDTLRFEASSNTVYSSITAADALGLTETYSATELGCSYLSALSIKEIPATAGEIRLEVTPFCEDAAGIRYVGETQTLTVNADGTWKLS